MKHLSIMMAMFLLVGCQTTQAEVETPPQVVKKPSAVVVKKADELDKLEEKLKKEEEAKKNKLDPNPFEGEDIPPNIVVTSNKPVICGRIDTILNNMRLKFNEFPVLMGEVEATMPDGPKKVMATLTYNKETGSYTFLEQMPAEGRLMCVLSSGTGKIREEHLKGSSF